jgi:3-oxoadipate enol-lactonase
MTEMLINGEAFAVRVEGNETAPVLMLAHALGNDMQVFDWIIPELVKHFRVVRYDARGHGASVVTPGPYSLEELGTDALNIMAALGLEKVNWIGLSMGSMVGLWLLTHAPEKIGKAVLANTAAQLGSAEMWNERIRTVEEEGLDVLAPSILENWFTKGFREHHSERVERVWEMLLRTPARGYAGACAALRDMDQREDIRAITNPVLVIVGRHDPVTTPGLGALVASAISGAKLVTLATAHMSCVEEPEAFTQASIEFLMAEAPMLTEEGTEHQVTPEVVAEAPPALKKPRKPRPTKLEVHEAYIDDAPTAEESEAAHHANGEAHAAHADVDVDAEDYASAPVVEAPAPRKPRRPKAAKAPAAKAAPVAEPAPTAAPAARPRRAAAKKAAPRKAAAKKTTARKAPARKAPAKKSSARKAVRSSARKAIGASARKAVKKAAPKKSARGTASTRKVASARKAVAKKTVAKKSAVRKSAVKKSAAKKAPVRKIAAKKATVRKAVVKKTQAKKAVRKTAAKKTTSRKPMPRRVPGRRPTRKR